MYFDWDVKPSPGYNSGGYDETSELAWMAYNNGSEKFNYRGVKVLQGTLASVYTQDWTKIAYPTYGDDGFTETEKFAALSDGFTTAITYADSANDYNQTVSVVLNNFASGATDTVAFAILAGDSVSIASFEEAADNAAVAYQGIITDVEDDQNPSLPEKFALHQNYPNPFNPQTTITFDLPKASEYTLSVYNLLGQEVDRFEDRAKAGTVKIVWDGEKFASGIYLYKVTAGDLTDSRKMILLK